MSEGDGRYPRAPEVLVQQLHLSTKESLQISDEDEAEKVPHARNEAMRHPASNLQMARAYWAAIPALSTRTSHDSTQ